MSRGAGRVEHAIEAYLRANPHDTFTIKELAQRIFGASEKPHRVSAGRALRRVLERHADLGGCWGVGLTAIRRHPGLDIYANSASPFWRGRERAHHDALRKQLSEDIAAGRRAL